MIHLLGTISLAVGSGAATLFVAAYWVSARWWRSEEGWHLMSFTAALALILDWLLYRNLITTARPAAIGEEIGRAAIYCAIAGLLLWRLWLLWRRQIRPSLTRKDSR